MSPRRWSPWERKRRRSGDCGPGAAQGDLVDFLSGDRYFSPDGRSGDKMPWSTPARDHRDFDGHRLPGRGDATWKTPQGDFVYGEFNLDAIEYFPPAAGRAEDGRG